MYRLQQIIGVEIPDQQEPMNTNLLVRKEKGTDQWFFRFPVGPAYNPPVDSILECENELDLGSEQPMICQAEEQGGGGSWRYGVQIWRGSGKGLLVVTWHPEYREWASHN